MLLLMWTGSSHANGEAASKTRDMVVTPHPLATAAGQEILKLGGTAADAMVAVQTVLGLVEPQSSGLGGGAFCVYYDADTDDITTLDGRETAPAAATENRFASVSNFLQAWQSGLSVGVPGVPRLLQQVHDKFGQLEWKRLFEPAQTLASQGFELSERTSATVSTLLDFNTNVLGFENCSQRLFFRDATAFNYFVDDEATCNAKPAGTLMTNQAYYETLVSFANEGADVFYTGSIAADIVAAVQGDLNIPGDMTMEDLANYQVVERQPVCGDYRNYSICGMGPPSSGGLAVSQMLGMLETFDLSVLEDPLNDEAVHLFTQVNRLAFADRNMFVADLDFVNVPVDGMLDKTYLASRADLIGENDIGVASAGVPPGVVMNETAADARAKQTGTSHISIVDQYGNALSFTSSIEAPFGNGVMVRGFLLNNELTDFSFAPTNADGTLIANRVQGNKRPRSSMSPTIVFDQDRNVKLLTGSVGGSTIIGHTAQSIMNILDFGLDPQEAVEVPHYQNNNENNTRIETPVPNVTRDYNVTALSAALTARFHFVEQQEMSSGLAVIFVTDDGVMMGGADKRRDVAVGGSNLNMSDDTSSSGSALNSWVNLLPVFGAWVMLALL